jgi:putative hydrolase of HD superfamily
MKQEDINKFLHFMEIAEDLKETERYTTYKSMKQKDSSASHSWRMSLMVILLAKEYKLNINLEKSIKLAIVHDLAEAITGDIDSILIANGTVSKKDKLEKEISALEEIKQILPGKSGKAVFELWHEFEETKTREAKFVRAIDKLETLNHIVNRIGIPIHDPGHTATYADEAIGNFPELAQLLIKFKKQLKKIFQDNNVPWKKEYGDI